MQHCETKLKLFQNACHQMIKFKIYLGLSIAPSDVLARAAPTPTTTSCYVYVDPSLTKPKVLSLTCIRRWRFRSITTYLESFLIVILKSFKLKYVSI